MLEMPASQDFEHCPDKLFRVSAEGMALSVEIVLAEVTSFPSSGDDKARREPFSALFKGPAAHFLPQGLYRLENTSLGSVELFLVPLGPSVDGAYWYEAVFN